MDMYQSRMSDKMNLTVIEHALRIVYEECIHTSCSDCEFRDGCDEVFEEKAMSDICSRLLEQIRQFKGE